MSAERARLAVFTNWLSSNGVRGYLGEVGWPNNDGGEGAKWNCLGDYIYQDADTAGLWATAWTTGELNPGPQHAYKPLLERTPVLTADNQATVIEAHPSTTGYRRGINFPDGRIGACYSEATCPKFSNMRPGVFGVYYEYGSPLSYAYLSTRGIKLIRLTFRWERLQPTPGGALNIPAMNQLKASLAAMGQLGFKVILCPSNQAGYYIGPSPLPKIMPLPDSSGQFYAIGEPQVPLSAFTNLWKRLSTAFKSNTTVLAYDLMNEPHTLASATWEADSQAALTAIRNNGDNKLVIVPGSAWSAAGDWTSNDPSPWITDPSSNFMYEAHQYFDDGSGYYLHSYAYECEQRNGNTPCP